MRSALLGCCLLAALLAAATPSSEVLSYLPHHPPLTVHRLELEDEEAEGAHHQSAHNARVVFSLLSAAGRPRDETTHCENVTEQTTQEKALCMWNGEYDDLKKNVTDAEWEFSLNMNGTEPADDLSSSRQLLLNTRNSTAMQLTGEPSTWINNASYPDEDEAALWGEMFILSQPGLGAADSATLEKLTTSAVGLLKAYTGVSVCPYGSSGCKEQDKLTIWDLQAKMASGQLKDEELKYYWREYRAAAQADLTAVFTDYIDSGKAAAKQAGLDHYGQFWLQPYGYSDARNESLLGELAATWAGLDGLYRSLHSVVRYRLNKAGVSGATDTQPLPAHLLGDMAAADWRNIYESTKPFDNYNIDITDTLVNKNYDIVKIRDDSAAYLKSMDLKKLSTNNCFLNESDWSLCTKGQNCDALAWTSGYDACVRIRATPEVTMDNYERIHAKSAELEYYLQYMSLDPEYRAPANPAFMEAVAGAISLSVLTPDHLNSTGLLPPGTQVDSHYDIDFLYRRALQYLAPLPFHYATQKWRWLVFSGQMQSSFWEYRWWTLREDIQGLQPPETLDTTRADPLAMPDIARDQPAFQHYMATLLQFQLFEQFCIEAGQYDLNNPTDKPLHRCDLTGVNTTSVKELMQAGNTRRWRELLEDFTVNGTLTGESMLRYFAPLQSHLQSVIKTNGLQTSWESNLGDFWSVDTTTLTVVGSLLGVFVFIVVVTHFVTSAKRKKGE